MVAEERWTLVYYFCNGIFRDFNHKQNQHHSSLGIFRVLRRGCFMGPRDISYISVVNFRLIFGTPKLLALINHTDCKPTKTELLNGVVNSSRTIFFCWACGISRSPKIWPKRIRIRTGWLVSRLAEFLRWVMVIIWISIWLASNYSLMDKRVDLS